MGEIFIIFSIFSDICYFFQIYENKIGILENDIYIFPIVNSVICEVYSFDMFCTVLYVLEV